MNPESVPTVPTENGNIEHSPTPKYKYDFVWNNYTNDDYNQVCQWANINCKKAVIGKEVGESGTPHLQGYISLKKKLRMTALVKVLVGASFRECRNEQALIDYCKKDGDYYSIGFPKPIKIISELYDWQKRIEDICLNDKSDRKIYWFWESQGNIGKSAFVKYMIVKHKSLFCSGGKYSDIMNLVFNQNMEDCGSVIFDIPRANKGNISYASLEAIKNGMVCNTKYETGVKIFNSPVVVCFANFPPDDTSQLSADRWVVECL